jgi:hypothetical protein
MNRNQPYIALVLITILLFAYGSLSYLSRSTSTLEWLEGPELRRFKDGDGLFMNRGSFVDFEDRIILDEIPQTNFKEGGIYFLGHSTLKWATAFWQLPAEQKPILHNFGIGASNHKNTANFISYLIENEGLIPENGAPVTVVLGCTWSMSLEWRNGFFSQLWGRYGLHRYDEQTGVQKIKLLAVQKWWLSESARLGGFISTSVRRGLRNLAAEVGVMKDRSKTYASPPEPAAFTHATKLDWQAEHERQMNELTRQIRELTQKGVHVKLALMPTRLGYRKLPFPAKYISDVKSLALKESVELLDLSDALTESEFVDLDHVNYLGLQKTHQALIRYVGSEIHDQSKWRLRPNAKHK